MNFKWNAIHLYSNAIPRAVNELFNLIRCNMIKFKKYLKNEVLKGQPGGNGDTGDGDEGNETGEGGNS